MNVRNACSPWTVNLKQLALSSMRTIIPLAEGAAERPAAVPAPVDHAWQPLVAGQAHWLGVVVWTNCSRDVIKQNLTSRNIPRCHKKTTAPILMENGVWKALFTHVHLQLICFNCDMAGYVRS